jgi:hypothetical protein
MATREAAGVGIDHLTVVPENIDRESEAGGPEGTSTGASSDGE